MTHTMDSNFRDVTFIGGTADWEGEATAPSPLPSAGSGGQRPLAMTAVGDRVWIIRIRGGHSLVRRLIDLGIGQGSEITVVSRTESGSVIVARQGCRIGLGAGIAHRVMVAALPPSAIAPVPSESTSVVNGEVDMTQTLTLSALAVGQSGRIVGYEPGGRAYRGKLLSMGLTPGTHFTVTRQAPMGDPVDVEVRGYHLSLRKGEAAALKVEPTHSEEPSHEV